VDASESDRRRADGERTVRAIDGVEGKRLNYKGPRTSRDASSAVKSSCSVASIEMLAGFLHENVHLLASDCRYRQLVSALRTLLLNPDRVCDACQGGGNLLRTQPPIDI
jgi:hypothetical protein